MGKPKRRRSRKRISKKLVLKERIRRKSESNDSINVDSLMPAPTKVPSNSVVFKVKVKRKRR